MVSSETQTDSQITGWHDGNAAKLAHLGNSTTRAPELNTSVSRDIHEPKEQKISRGACGYNKGACTHRNTTTFFRPTTCKVRYTLPSNIFEDCNRLSGTAVSFDDLGDTIKPHPFFCYAQGRAGQSDYLTWGVLSTAATTCLRPSFERGTPPIFSRLQLSTGWKASPLRAQQQHNSKRMEQPQYLVPCQRSPPASLPSRLMLRASLGAQINATVPT